MRQAQQHVARVARAGRGRPRPESLELVIGQPRDDRRDHGADRDPGGAQLLDRLQAPMGCRGARLELAGKLGIERGDRNEDPRQTIRRHRREQVEIAQDRRRLGDDGDRVPAAGQDLEHAARDLQPPLQRLVGVGVGPKRDRRAAVAGRRELALQQVRRIVLGEQLGLEIEAGRQTEEGMCRPRETVDAAVLAAAIGVDRAVERNVGRLVARDHAAAGVGEHLGARRRPPRPAAPATASRRRTGRARWVSNRTFGLKVAPRPL